MGTISPGFFIYDAMCMRSATERVSGKELADQCCSAEVIRQTVAVLKEHNIQSEQAACELLAGWKFLNAEELARNAWPEMEQ